ncbi:SDR family NAD(P)-dependent oxidoreductase [Mycobacterium sp. 1274761.0]|uniref:SDR family NAD(P)-dependent oxidoreductase n=1 Tax=Mycobacterium sp. 1274761.0 TaxID=1834077 RepID=UPI0007FC6433|nr:SDR family NAD(P)-dependent oxidoreductase [Mycobacterium sp. 1274761.0]OBK76457.1 retinol dehydrogenase [Mycobacterium sp. 1274761.0]
MPTVLVTGAARGIGRAIVEHLASAGWDVIAGVRSQQDADAVVKSHPQRVSAVILDITDPDQIAALPASLPQRLDALVNNAGIAVGGPVETVTAEDWRNVLETNVIGQFAVTQAVLPRLRESRGRVVFISSVNGRIATPMLGPYSASKFALEAGCDALRIELKAWGIPVVLIEPAQTDTDMWRTADDMVRQIEASLAPEQRELYSRHIAGMKKFVPTARRMASPTKKVVAVVEKALTTRKPKARYVVALLPKIQAALVPNLPVAVRDRVLGMLAGLPRRPRD